jgi:hypothetical protein
MRGAQSRASLDPAVPRRRLTLIKAIVAGVAQCARVNELFFGVLPCANF